MLELIKVCKSYASVGGEAGVLVLDGIDLEIEKGASVAIVGPSGSGKSTLLNIAGGLDKPTSGRVLLGGKDICVLDDLSLSRVRNRQIGFVFQLHHLLGQCTVLENVLIPSIAFKSSRSAKATEAYGRDLLERVGLGKWVSHRPGEISVGQRQRVAVVRALINRPSLLLADEPTGSLDKAASENIAELLVELNQSEQVTLVVVTHSMAIAWRMGKVYNLSDGVLVERMDV
jgi:ABC-type lipoprotein export system ATPase subunit